MGRTVRDSKGRNWRLKMTFQALGAYRAETGHCLIEAETAAEWAQRGAPPPCRRLRPLARLDRGDCSSFLILAMCMCAKQRKQRHVSRGAFLAAIVNEETFPALIRETKQALGEWLKNEYLPLSAPACAGQADRVAA